MNGASPEADGFPGKQHRSSRRRRHQQDVPTSRRIMPLQEQNEEID